MFTGDANEFLGAAVKVVGLVGKVVDLGLCINAHEHYKDIGNGTQVSWQEIGKFGSVRMS